MKIYTKTGDKGLTSLFGGTRVSKHNLRIESYGCIDELNAQIGFLRDSISQNNLKDALLTIQNQLFTLGAMLATDPNKQTLKNGKDRLNIPKIGEAEVLNLEQQIDIFNETLPNMTHFILPGGHPVVSICHIARTLCRKAERHIVALQEQSSVETVILKYINRLSDYLFVLARKLAAIYQVDEILWIPEKQ